MNYIIIDKQHTFYNFIIILVYGLMRRFINMCMHGNGMYSMQTALSSPPVLKGLDLAAFNTSVDETVNPFSHNKEPSVTTFHS